MKAMHIASNKRKRGESHPRRTEKIGATQLHVRLLSAPGIVSPEMVLALQQTVGNQVVQRLLDNAVGSDSLVDEGGPLSSELASAIQQARGTGNPLPDGVRQEFEPRLGHDLDDVRVHTDVQADVLSRSVHARAFVIGGDIFFRTGVYAPDSAAGREVLTHELTHVVQQSGASQDSGGLRLGSADDAHEREARQAAHRSKVSDASRARSTGAGTVQRIGETVEELREMWKKREQAAQQSATPTPVPHTPSPTPPSALGFWKGKESSSHPPSPKVTPSTLPPTSVTPSTPLPTSVTPTVPAMSSMTPSVPKRTAMDILKANQADVPEANRFSEQFLVSSGRAAANPKIDVDTTKLAGITDPKKLAVEKLRHRTVAPDAQAEAIRESKAGKILQDMESSTKKRQTEENLLKVAKGERPAPLAHPISAHGAGTNQIPRIVSGRRADEVAEEAHAGKTPTGTVNLTGNVHGVSDQIIPAYTTTGEDPSSVSSAFGSNVAGLHVMEEAFSQASLLDIAGTDKQKNERWARAIRGKSKGFLPEGTGSGYSIPSGAGVPGLEATTDPTNPVSLSSKAGTKTPAQVMQERFQAIEKQDYLPSAKVIMDPAFIGGKRAGWQVQTAFPTEEMPNRAWTRPSDVTQEEQDKTLSEQAHTEAKAAQQAAEQAAKEVQKKKGAIQAKEQAKTKVKNPSGAKSLQDQIDKLQSELTPLETQANTATLEAQTKEQASVTAKGKLFDTSVAPAGQKQVEKTSQFAQRPGTNPEDVQQLAASLAGMEHRKNPRWDPVQKKVVYDQL